MFFFYCAQQDDLREKFRHQPSSNSQSQSQSLSDSLDGSAIPLVEYTSTAMRSSRAPRSGGSAHPHRMSASFPSGSDAGWQARGSPQPSSATRLQNAPSSGSRPRHHPLNNQFD